MAIGNDVNNRGIAALLFLKHNEAFMPVQFVLKMLTSAQNGYATIDKEAVAVMYSFNAIEGPESFRYKPITSHY